MVVCNSFIRLSGDGGVLWIEKLNNVSGVYTDLFHDTGNSCTDESNVLLGAGYMYSKHNIPSCMEEHLAVDRTSKDQDFSCCEF